MFDIWIGEMNLTVLVLIFTCIIVLPLQLLLCYKVKSRIVRLLPIFLFLFFGVLSLALVYLIPGWDSLIFGFTAIYAGFMMFACGLGWFIWAIANYFIKKK